MTEYNRDILQLYRGTYGGIPVLLDGEPGWSTDAYRLFIGQGGTNRLVGEADFVKLAGSTMTGALTLASDPTVAMQAVTKQYADSLVMGVKPLTQCRIATTANITLSGLQTIDSVLTGAGDRVLVKNQTLAKNNGVYVAASGAWSRTTDADIWSELYAAAVWITSGTTNGFTKFYCTIPASGTLGTDNITWVMSDQAVDPTLPLSASKAVFTDSNGDLVSRDHTGTLNGGKVVLDLSPTLVTPTLGAATATTINNLALTSPAATATLTLGSGKTFTASNTITLTAIDGSTLAIGAGGTVTYRADNLSVFAATTSAQLAGIISDETGTGFLAFSDSPVFTTKIFTPAIQTASGALAIAPAAGSNLNIALSTTGDFAVNTNHLYVDTSTGYVGIGTTTPGYKLEVMSASSAPSLNPASGIFRISTSDTVTGLSIGVNPSSPYGTWIQSTNQPSTSGGTYPLSLNPLGGNVGIGTTDPGGKFHIKADDNTNTIYLRNDGITNRGINILLYSKDSGSTLRGSTVMFNPDDNRLAFGGSYVTAGLVLNQTSGNVGIGTTNPAYLLDVRGTAQFGTAAAGSILRLTGKSGITQNWQIKTDTTTAGLRFTEDGGLASVTFLDTGNVGIGTTNPTTALQVNGTVTAPGFAGTLTGTAFSSTATASTPTTMGWYRVATSASDVTRNAATFEILTTSNHSRSIFTAGQMYFNGTALNLLLYTTYNGLGITKARIVYHPSLYSGKYAYVEVYKNSTEVEAITCRIINSVGWTSVAPNTAGEIPAGYTSTDLDFTTGLATTGDLNVAGKVGIGTTNPGGKLGLTSAASNATGLAGTGAIFSLRNTSNSLDLVMGQMAGSPYTTWIQARHASSDNAFYPISINPLGGNVGIGTTNPGAKLDIRSTSGSALYLNINDAGGYGLDVDITLAFRGMYVRGASVINNIAGNLNIGNGATSIAGAGGLYVQGTSLLNGNVGFGTTTPAAGVHALYTTTTNGDARYNTIIGDNTAYNINVGGGISFQGKYNSGGSYADFASIQGIKENTTDGNYATALRFTTRANGGSPTERVRIGSSGNVGIGITNPISKLHLGGQSANPALTIGEYGYTNGVINIPHSLSINFDSANAATTEVFQISHNKTGIDGNNVLLHINESGYVGVGTTGPKGNLDITANFPTLYLCSNASAADQGSWRVQAHTDGTLYFQAVNDANNNVKEFMRAERNAGANTIKYVSFPNGNVGIGTTGPDGKFHVMSASAGAVTAGSSADEGIFEGAGNTGITILSPDANQANIHLGSPTNDTGALIRWVYNDGLLTIGTNKADADLRFLTSTSSERVRVKGDSGYVGIGTANPGDILQVTGGEQTGIRISTTGNVAHLDLYQTALANANARNWRIETNNGNWGALEFRVSSANNTAPSVFKAGFSKEGYFGINESAPLSFLAVKGGVSVGSASYSTAASPANGMIIEGNVGIGTTNPGTKLDVNGGAIIGSTANRGVLAINGSSSETPAIQLIDNITNGKTWTLYSGSAGVGTFSIFDSSANTHPFVIKQSTGYVGIGTTNPGTKLDVNGNTTARGNLAITTDQTEFLTVTGAGTSRSHATINNTGGNLLWGVESSAGNSLFTNGIAYAGVIGTQTSDAFQLASNNTVRVTVDTNGNVGIGTTNPEYTLQVGQNTTGNSTDYGISINRHGSLASPGSWTNTSALAISELANAGPASVDTAGLFSISLGRFTVSSTNAKNATLMHVGSYDSGLSAMRVDGKANTWIGWDRGTAPTVTSSYGLLVSGGVSVGATYQLTSPPTSGMIVEGNVGIGTTNPGAKLAIANSTAGFQFGVKTPDMEAYDFRLYNAPQAPNYQALDRGGILSIGTRGGAPGYISLTTEGSACFALANGKVGIGTTSPNSKLDIISGNIQLSDDQYILWHGTTSGAANNAIRGSDVLNSLTFRTNAADQVTINSSGNVGIGTTNPTAKLAVIGSIYSNATQTNTVFNGGVGTDNANFMGSDGYWAIRSAINESYNLDMYNSGSPIAAMTVLQSGNVGIGTTAPRKLTDFLSASQSQLRLSYADNTIYSDFTVGSGGNLTIAPTGDFIFDPAGNSIMPGTGYDLSLGSLSKKYLALHAAELYAETLVAQNTIATIGGRILIGETTVLTSDLVAAATTIYVKHNKMTSGDRVYMEANGAVEFMGITSAPSGAGPYSYTVTRNLDGTGANDWSAGDAIFNTGTAGDGFIDLYSFRGVKSATQYGPAIVGNVRNSSTYNDWTEHWAIGNMNGLYGYGVDTYGAAFGKYAGGNYLTVDVTNGVRFFDSGNAVRGQLSSAAWTLGSTSTEHVAISTTSVQIKDGSTVYADLTSGALKLGDASNEHAIVDANGITLKDNTTTYAQFAATTTIGSVATQNVYITSTSLQLREATTTYVNLNASSLLMGQTGAAQSNLYLTSGAVQLRNNTTTRISLAADGSGYLANDNIVWDTSGNLTIGASAYIGGSTNGWQISTGTITALGTGVFQTNNSSNTGIKINTTALAGYNGTIQTVKVATDGSGWFGVTGTRAIEWTTAGAVTIAGWAASSSRISSANLYIDQAGQYISMGAAPPTSYGNNVGAWLGVSTSAKMSLYADTSNYLQWDGSKLLVKAANFALDSAGNLTASSATLSGFVSSSNIYGSSLMTRGAYLTTTCSAGATTIYVNDTTDFTASGTAWIIDDLATGLDTFSYTGKTSTTLTGCSGVLAHVSSATHQPLVAANKAGVYIAGVNNELYFFGQQGMTDTTINKLLDIGNLGEGDPYLMNVGSSSMQGIGINITTKNLSGLQQTFYFTENATHDTGASFSTVTSQQAANSSKTVRGLSISANHTVAYNIATLGGATIDYGHAGGSASATTTTSYGLKIIPHHSAGTISTSIALLLAAPAEVGGIVTNRYAISQEDASAKNYFAGNVGIGLTAFGTDATNTLGIYKGTGPTTAPNYSVQLWADDVNGAVGYTGLHMRTGITNLKLIVPGVYLKSSTGQLSAPFEGIIEINTTDNTIKMYADAGWRTLVTW